jgi:hypothetical protein
VRDSKVMLETPVQSIFGLGQRNIGPPFRVCDWRFGMYWEWLGHSLPLEEGKGTHGTTQDKHGLSVEYACNNQKVGAKGYPVCPRVNLPMAPKLFLAFCVAALEAKCKHL